MADQPTVFAGSTPGIYDRFLVPLIFEPYAEELARRLAERGPSRVIEVAAGTGAVTRALAAGLPPSTAVVATDISAEMLAVASARGAARPVEWRLADALALPFPDASFDAYVCQFGVMFFPDRRRACAEAKRVVRAGGTILFAAWDALHENEIAETVEEAVAALFPHDPPRFLSRAPYAYHDPAAIRRDVIAGGLSEPSIEKVEARSRAPSPRDAAIAFTRGTPLAGEIRARDEHALERATDAAAAAIARRFGSGPIDAKMQALVVSAER